MNDFNYSTTFRDIVKVVQLRFDAASEAHKKLFDKVIFQDYLDWDEPTVGLDFDAILGKYNITIAAPTIGDHSSEPAVASDGLDILRDKLLHHAIIRKLSAQDFRKIWQLLDSRSINDKTKTQQLVNTMWGEVTAVVDAVLAKLDIIFLNALTNCGKCTLDSTNNPEGGVSGVIDYKQPADNIVGVTTKWIDTNLSTVDCFEDILGVIDAASHVQFAKILCAPSLLTYLCKADSTRKLIWGSDKGSRAVVLKDLNDYMLLNGFPIFEPIRRLVRIQDGTIKKDYNPVNEKNLVFIPEGKLGVVKNAYADSELTPEEGVAYSNYGRVRVSQWKTGDLVGSSISEYTKAEAFALPVITEFNGIYTLKTQD